MSVCCFSNQECVVDIALGKCVSACLSVDLEKSRLNFVSTKAQNKKKKENNRSVISYNTKTIKFITSD